MNFSVLNHISSEIKHILKRKEEIIFVELSAGTCSGTVAFLKILQRIHKELKEADGEKKEKNEGEIGVKNRKGSDRKGKERKKVFVFIQDISKFALEFGEKIIREFLSESAGLPFDIEIFQSVGDVSRLKIQKMTGGRNPDIVLMSFSLYDVFRYEVEDMIAWCDKVISSLSDEGFFIFVEPAVKDRNSLFLMKIRDALRKYVVSPCPHKLDCPLLKKGDDWCHFGVKWIPPDFLTRGMYLIGGRPPDLNFSYLIFSKSGNLLINPPDEKGENNNLSSGNGDYVIARVVSHKLAEKGRVRFWTCENGKKNLYQFLRRNSSDKNAEVEDVHSGDLVKIHHREERNGYFEITQESEFKIIRKLFE